MAKIPLPAEYTNPSRRHFTSSPLSVVEHSPMRSAAAAPNQDRKLLKDLAAGRYEPEAVLDLHGLTTPEAFLKVMDWVHQAADHDCRCVLIITGKGRGFGPTGNMGMLRDQTPEWLGNHPRVMAYHTALPRDGGSGALYVYLRRRKD
jgi:DNA-nicking Smr family endonuclease